MVLPPGGGGLGGSAALPSSGQLLLCVCRCTWVACVRVVCSLLSWPASGPRHVSDAAVGAPWRPVERSLARLGCISESEIVVARPSTYCYLFSLSVVCVFSVCVDVLVM